MILEPELNLPGESLGRLNHFRFLLPPRRTGDFLVFVIDYLCTLQTLTAHMPILRILPADIRLVYCAGFGAIVTSYSEITSPF